MPVGELEQVFGVLSAAGVRYLVVGGVAVVLHGHPRFTADLDLVLALDPPNIRAALAALAGLEYRPRVPVEPAALADPNRREEWIREKGMSVFSMWSPQLPATEIDILVEAPFVFHEAYARAVHIDLGDVTVSVASIADIITLKRHAGRARDQEDIDALRAIAKTLGENP